MVWRLEINMNGLSLAFARTPHFVQLIRKLQHREHAYGKPYLRGFFA